MGYFLLLAGLRGDTDRGTVASVKHTVRAARGVLQLTTQTFE